MRGTAGAVRPRRQSGLRRSLQEFLAVPLAMIVAFTAAAALTTALDHSTAAWLQPVQQAASRLFPPQENQAMLRTVAPGVLTLMTITFFLLLTLVQRMADIFTWVVVEQFLSRRANQALFGYFAGLSTYYVVVLAATNPQQSVFSTIAALIFSVLALVAMVVFGYLILDQMRAPSVVQRIVQVTIATRAEQLNWLRRVREESLLKRLPAMEVRSGCSGYLIDIDLDGLARAARSATGEAEVEFATKLGSHLVEGSHLATVRAHDAVDRERLADAVLDALRFGRERQLNREPLYGVHQLSSMGWAAATQRDPEAALVTVDGLHTLLAHWVRRPGPQGNGNGERLPIVYCDSTIAEVLSALASVAVGAIEGGQHQTCAHVLNVFAMVLPELSVSHQRMATAHLRHALVTATRHSFTAEMQEALTALGGALSDTGHADAAADLSRIKSRLGDQLPSS